MTRKTNQWQLTIRGSDARLHDTLVKLARSRGVSLSKAALMLLRKGAGLEGPRQHADAVGDSLDHLIGSWSMEQEQEFLRATESLEQVDEGLWL